MCLFFYCLLLWIEHYESCVVLCFFFFLGVFDRVWFLLVRCDGLNMTGDAVFACRCVLVELCFVVRVVCFALCRVRVMFAFVPMLRSC